ncbi:MAG: ATP-binding cassette domain-containing protein, partial [Lachnospiraceae bacterium]|nr:ATP-binding cassette domain-containing protein [Lachnospiraceae bacterium]
MGRGYAGKDEVPVIALEHVSKNYQEGMPALKDVNIRIYKGEFVFIIGNSGSGKSTLLKLLMKEINPTEGKIFVNGKILSRLRRTQVAKYRRGIGMVFQDFRLLKDR